MDLTAFFRDEDIDAFAVIGIGSLGEADRWDVLQFFPAARSVIVFGKEVPVTAYRLPAKEKTREMVRIAEQLDAAAVRLAGILETENIPAKPVPLYLPVKVREGKVQGLVRLKHVAAAGGLGSLGKSSILLSPRFGPRLLLSGVVSGLPFERYSPGDRVGFENPCTGCDRCVRACPGNAIGPDGVEAFRCRSLRAWVPPALVPAVKWLIGRTFLQGAAAPLAPHIARMGTIRCNLCVTGCPKFSAKEGNTGPNEGDAEKRMPRKPG
jgi:epoxyqueuosine reductase QueG